MKSVDEVISKIAARLQADWHLAAVGATGRWPQTIPLGLPARAGTLEANFEEVRRWSLGWQEWEHHNPAEIVRVNRVVHGTNQRLPTHVRIMSADDAAAIAGEPWPSRIRRGTKRHRLLAERFKAATDLASVVRAVDNYSGVDFQLLLDTATWFTDHDAAGMTTRQVPIEGLHTKWLNTSQHLVARLAGKPDLGLTTSRPARVHYRYLDPGWNGRRYDLSTAGDENGQPLYRPRTIIICENRDTAQLFPPISQGIAVEGDGLAAAGVLNFFPWIRDCRNIFYWGDIDAAGYEILHSLRQSGIPARSILMDEPAYLKYERFGTRIDAKGTPIKCSDRKDLPDLTRPEREVYLNLTDQGWTRVRRIEQEKMLLSDGVAALAAATAASS